MKPKTRQRLRAAEKLIYDILKTEDLNDVEKYLIEEGLKQIICADYDQSHRPKGIKEIKIITEESK